jgi:quercetin dioxygenase-like cupin family protein
MEETKSWQKGDVHYHVSGKHAATNNGNSSAEWLAFVVKNTELPACPDHSPEKDLHAVAPDFINQRYANERFMVTEVTLPEGETIPMHSGINRIIYSLSDYQILYESDKAGKEENSFKTGDIHWHEACQHALENTGQSEAHFLVVAFSEAEINE